MLGIDAKRGIVATCEKVFQSSGSKFESLDVLFSGSTACIKFQKVARDTYKAVVFIPDIDDIGEVTTSKFNDLIGFVLHELGHAWFTENAPWDKAVEKHGKYLGSLINGLEDPRIENSVIDSNHAPNSRNLFEALINSMIKKNGYPTELNKGSLPFILAVEGRRLNGYRIDVPDLISTSIFASDINDALEKSHKASSTKQIVNIAIELYEKLFPPEEVDEKGDKEGDKEGDEVKDEAGDKLPEGKEYPVEPNEFIESSTEDLRPKAINHDFPLPTIRSIHIMEFTYV